MHGSRHEFTHAKRVNSHVLPSCGASVVEMHTQNTDQITDNFESQIQTYGRKVVENVELQPSERGNVLPGAVLHRSSSPSPTPSRSATVNVRVRTVLGQDYNIECQKDDTFSAVREKIFSMTSVAPNLQQLVFAGRELLDSQTIGQCGICDGSTIQLAPRLCAGNSKSTTVVQPEDEDLLQTLRALSDEQIDELIANKTPLTFVSKVGDQHMVVHVQLVADDMGPLRQMQHRLNNPHKPHILQSKSTFPDPKYVPVERAHSSSSLQSLLQPKTKNDFDWPDLPARATSSSPKSGITIPKSPNFQRVSSLPITRVTACSPPPSISVPFAQECTESIFSRENSLQFGRDESSLSVSRVGSTSSFGPNDSFDGLSVNSVSRFSEKRGARTKMRSLRQQLNACMQDQNSSMGLIAGPAPSRGPGGSESGGLMSEREFLIGRRDAAERFLEGMDSNLSLARTISNPIPGMYDLPCPMANEDPPMEFGVAPHVKLPCTLPSLPTGASLFLAATQQKKQRQPSPLGGGAVSDAVGEGERAMGGTGQNGDDSKQCGIGRSCWDVSPAHQSSLSDPSSCGNLLVYSADTNKGNRLPTAHFHSGANSLVFSSHPSVSRFGNDGSPKIAKKAKETLRSLELTRATCVSEQKTTETNKFAGKPGRCGMCGKKVGLVAMPCRCGTVFCPAHRLAEDHECGFDYKHAGRQALASTMPAMGKRSVL